MKGFVERSRDRKGAVFAHDLRQLPYGRGSANGVSNTPLGKTGEADVAMGNLSQPLRRSVIDRNVAGVCGGLGEYAGIDPTVVRVVYVLASIFSAAFPGILIYIILWLLIPEREYY